MKTYHVSLKDRVVPIQADTVILNDGALEFEKENGLVACFAAGNWIYFEGHVKQPEFVQAE